MWPDMIEFRSASSEIRGQIKRERKKEESVVKHKSADMYVGRPNKGKRTGPSSPVSAAHFNVLLLHSRVQYTALNSSYKLTSYSPNNHHCYGENYGTLLSNIIITTASQLHQKMTAENAPRIDTLRTEIYAFVCIHDSSFYWSVFRPYQRQHASNANQTTSHSSLKAIDKEVYGFMDVSQRLGAEQLTDDWDDLINLADKCQGVLHSQFNKFILSWHIPEWAAHGLWCLAGCNMPVHAFLFGGQFWPVK